MAKVTGPLFSLSASGSVAGKLTIRNTRHGFTAVHKTTPHDPATQFQLIERQTMRDAAAAWNTLDPEIKLIWNSSAIPTIKSGWMDFFQEWKTQRIAAGSLPLIPTNFIGVPPAIDWPEPEPINDLGTKHTHSWRLYAHPLAVPTSNRGTLRVHTHRNPPRITSTIAPDRGAAYAHGMRAAPLATSTPPPTRGDHAAHGLQAAPHSTTAPSNERGALRAHGTTRRIHKI